MLNRTNRTVAIFASQSGDILHGHAYRGNIAQYAVEHALRFFISAKQPTSDTDNVMLLLKEVLAVQQAGFALCCLSDSSYSLSLWECCT